MKLTKAQAFALVDLDEHRFNDGWRRAPVAGKVNLQILRQSGLIEGQHDGGRYVAHRITAAGRATLASGRKP